MMEINLNELRAALNYDADTGVFTWKSPKAHNVKPGDIAGHLMACGYRRITFKGKDWLAHRLAWFFVHGAWPADQIDHRNGVRDDNRLSNLRACSRSENSQNRTSCRNSSSKFLGVSFDRTHRLKNRWVATIQLNGVSQHLGYFPTEEAASIAYASAKKELHTFNPVVRQAA